MGAATDLVKSALEYLLGGPAVGGADEERLRRWFALPGPDLIASHARARYVIVNSVASTERRQRPQAIAAVAIERMQLDFAGCFTAQLRAPSIVESKSAILDFLEFLQKAPLVAFDAKLERARLERAMKSLLGVPLRHPWIDLGALLPALFPNTGCASRDEWGAHLRVTAAVHDPALGGALVDGQLLQIALDAAARAGATNARALIELVQARASVGVK